MTRARIVRIIIGTVVYLAFAIAVGKWLKALGETMERLVIDVETT